MKKIKTYEQQVKGLEPDFKKESKTLLDTEWIINEKGTTIIKRIDKVSGVIQWFQRRSNPNKPIPVECGKLDDFVMITADVAAARKKRLLTYDEAAVLTALAENIEYEKSFVLNDNGTRMSMVQVSEYIDKDKNWTRTVLLSLEEKGFITINKSSKPYTLKISPRFVWKGKIEKRSAATAALSRANGASQANINKANPVLKPKSASAFMPQTYTVYATDINDENNDDDEMDEDTYYGTDAVKGQNVYAYGINDDDMYDALYYNSYGGDDDDTESDE